MTLGLSREPASRVMARDAALRRLAALHRRNCGDEVSSRVAVENGLLT